jgi:glycerate-2-kinase
MSESDRLQKIKNIEALLSHGQKKVREDALKIIDAGIVGGDPETGTRRQVRVEGHILQVAGETFDLGAIENIYVVGAGKGSLPIAEALEDILGSLITEGVVVVKRGMKKQLNTIEIFEAGHPIPDDDSIVGAQKIIDVTSKAGEDDLVFAAVTGGSSALVWMPPEGIYLKDIQDTTDLLLKCGAVIREINIVRKHLCKLKGGQLVTRIQPAEAVTLTLDTQPEGMPWPDMSLADPSSFQDAIDVLKHFDLWEKVSPSIAKYLTEGVNRSDLETPKSLEGMRTRVVSVGDPVSACLAAAERAKSLNYTPAILSANLEGEAKDVGICLGGIAREIIKYKRPFAPPCVLISGGETTVTIAESCGTGGPNQELVLGFALTCREDARFACVSVDTDGTDGPTEIAGGIVDNLTLKEAADSNVGIAEHLKNHNSSEALTRLENAVITGSTGTNVLDLRVVVIQ